MHALLQEILDDVRPLLGQGRVASYIPALADVPPDQLGIAVCSAEGEVFEAGDAQTPFSIQSISKVFSLVQAIAHCGESLWERLGHEPSGQPFNSLVQLEFERGRPRNPFINAGALVICDVNQSRFATPELSMRDFVRHLSGNRQIVSDTRVAESEYQHRARNAAMAARQERGRRRHRRGGAGALHRLRLVAGTQRRGQFADRHGRPRGAVAAYRLVHLLTRRRGGAYPSNSSGENQA